MSCSARDMPELKRIEVRRLVVMSEDAEPVRVSWGSDLSRTQISRRAWWKDLACLNSGDPPVDGAKPSECCVSNGSICHSGARASAREPGIHKPGLWLWIPG